MKLRTVFSLVALAFGTAVLCLAVQDSSETKLVVHEWGTFTSIAGDDGMALEWRPLAGDSDLPGFVYNIAAPKNGRGIRGSSGGKQDLAGLIRMETPVVYFYSDREMDVSVKVGFPKGQVTEWYPRARLVNAGIDWGRIKVLRDLPASFPIEKGPSRYYAARETDASPVRVCSDAGNQIEKFLFYRGVGSFNPPLAVTLEGGKVRVKNLGADPIGEVILFERRNGQVGYHIQRDAADETILERPVGGGSLESLLGEIEKTLVSHGLYAKEAEAMIETWRDSWFEEGLRVFYILPRPVTDAVLPITIDPQPTQLVRVLVGRIEIIAPEMEQAIRAEMERLDDPSPEVRAAAQAALRKRGRFAEPVLKRLLRGQDDATREALVKGIFG